MAVRLFVSPNAELRDVGVHHAVGQAELNVPSTRAARLPLGKLEAGQIGDEVRLPLVASRFHQHGTHPRREVARFLGSLTEIEVVLEDEPLTVEQVDHDRQIRDRRDARGSSRIH